VESVLEKGNEPSIKKFPLCFTVLDGRV